MKVRAIELFCVVVILFVTAFLVVGCKDEPEDPNKWVISEPYNPILYIGYDTLRLQVGSSIKYVEIGDPNIIVSYFEPNMPTDLCIEFDSNSPEGFIIKGCYFNIAPELDPNDYMEFDANDFEIVESKDFTAIPNPQLCKRKHIHLRNPCEWAAMIGEDLDWGVFETDCSCGKHLSATYPKPHYRFVCATCDAVYTNTNCKTEAEFFELVGAGWLNN